VQKFLRVAFTMPLGEISTWPNWISDWKSWRYERNFSQVKSEL